MNAGNETFEKLWEFSTSNNRLVPMPPKWRDLYGPLKNTRQKPSDGWGDSSAAHPDGLASFHAH